MTSVGGDAGHIIDCFVTHPRVHEILVKGENKASVKIGMEGLQVDLRALPAASYGAALQYFSGSKTHNVALRPRALKLGSQSSAFCACCFRSLSVIVCLH